MQCLPAMAYREFFTSPAVDLTSLEADDREGTTLVSCTPNMMNVQH